MDSNATTTVYIPPASTAESGLLTPEQMDARLRELLAYTNPYETDYRAKVRLALDTLRARALVTDDVERQSLTTLLHAQLVHLGLMAVPMPPPPPGEEPGPTPGFPAPDPDPGEPMAA